MNIIMAFNTGFLTPSLTAIYTLFKHNNDVNLNIMYIDLSYGAQEVINRLQNVGKNNRVSYIKVSEELMNRVQVPTGRWRAESFFRYFSDELFPDWNRCLWLDSDIMVRGSLTELYNTELDGDCFAGVHDNSSDPQSRLGLNGYVNSGILVINLEMLRINNRMKDFWELISSKEYAAELPDQDALNIIFNKEIKHMPFIWNTFPIFKVANQDTLAYQIENAVIVHFASATKPWNMEGAGIYESLFDEYPSAATFVPEYWNYMDEAYDAVSKVYTKEK